jgi:hypothetical protein
MPSNQHRHRERDARQNLSTERFTVLDARRRYPHLGDSVRLGTSGRLRLACCDCDLVHDITATKVGDRIVLTILRNDSETTRLRSLHDERR